MSSCQGRKYSTGRVRTVIPSQRGK
ncbi:hypothetical protein LINPERHAP1_LOCUS25398 [Linum perenne]